MSPENILKEIKEGMAKGQRVFCRPQGQPFFPLTKKSKFEIRGQKLYVMYKGELISISDSKLEYN